MSGRRQLIDGERRIREARGQNGRKPLPPERNLKADGVRVVFYAKHDTLAVLREYARYEGVTIQEITRRCWRKVIAHAQQSGKIDFHGATKNT